MSGEELSRQIDHYLSRIQISDRFKDWALKYLHELHGKETESRNDIIEAQQKAYRACLGRIDNLVKLKTSPDNADGTLLSDEEYGRQRMELLKEKAAFEELLRDAGHRVEGWMTLAEQTFEFACTARSRFAKGDAKTKKEILQAIGSNLTMKDKKLSIQATKPFLMIENSLSDSKEHHDTLEPTNTGLTQGQKVTTPSHRLRGLGDMDDVRTYGRKWPKLVKSVYQFFQRRSVCSCEECQEGFFDTAARLARLKRQPRWNSLPRMATQCVFTGSLKPGELSLLGRQPSRINPRG